VTLAIYPTAFQAVSRSDGAFVKSRFSNSSGSLKKFSLFGAVANAGAAPCLPVGAFLFSVFTPAAPAVEGPLPGIASA
jgi:hypothetical protein